MNLDSPADGNVSAYSDGVIFFCNATDDAGVMRLSLYTDVNGTMSRYSTRNVMELENDTETLLMCRFDDNYTCVGGETATYSGTDIEPAKLVNGTMVNGSDTLRYDSAGNINSIRGTIEFWVKVGFDPYSDDVWLFSTTFEDNNDMRLYTDSYSGRLIFEYFDEYYGDGSEARKDISSWSTGQWHHVALVWDVEDNVGSGTEVDIFIDGSNSSATYDGEIYSYGNSVGDYFYIGSNGTGYLQADSAYDEFRVSNVTRTPAEILASYNKGGSGHTSESANWTVASIPDGEHRWTCAAHDNDRTFSWAGENRTFTVDMSTGPVLNSITTTPDSADDIDPGTTITVTANITDPSGVSAAILQYKHDVDWNNVTMNNVGGDLWNASFPTVASERTYYYRVWSNDSLGRSNTSQSSSVNVTWDYTWLMTPTTLEVYGVVDSVSWVGIIRVNNTGDDTIVFTLSDNWPLDVYYNTTIQFALPAKNVTDVNVTARYADSDGSTNMTVSISADPSPPSKTASPLTRGTLVTMNSYSGGPYIVTGLSVPFYVQQSGNATNLTATVKNIGNETAENIWVNWTLPAGWSNVSGNATHFAGNISSQETATIRLNASLSSSAASGIASVCINVSGSGNLTGYACGTASVSCSGSDGVCGSGCNYLTDSDCSAPSGGTTTTTGGGTSVATETTIVREPAMELTMPSRSEFVKGGIYNISVWVKNSVEGTNITDLVIGVSGYPATLVERMPYKLPYISYGERKRFVVEFTVPTYMEEKDHIVTVTLTGTGNYAEGNKTIKNAGRMTVSVQGVVEEVSLGFLRDAEGAMEEMDAMNFTADVLSTMLEDARKAYAELDFDQAKQLASEVIELKEKAFAIDDLIKRTDELIREAELSGIAMKETKKMQELAKAAFLRGDYRRAEERAMAASTTYLLESKNLLYLVKTIRERWYIVLPLLVIAAFSAMHMRKRARVKLLELRLSRARDRKEAAKALIKELQGEYYAEGGISKMDYEVRKKEHEKRIAEADSEELRLIAGIETLKTGDDRKSLLREKSGIRRRLKGLQRRYFESGKMGKGEYEEAVEELQAELAETEKNLARKKRPARRSRKGKKGMAAMVLLLALTAFLPAAALENATAGDALSAISEAEAVLEEMESLGFRTGYANHTLEEAKALLAEGDYDLAVTNARYVKVIRDKARIVDRMTDDVESRLYDLSARGWDVSGPQAMFDEGAAEFGNENYERAEELMDGAMDELDRMEREAALAGAADQNPLEMVCDFVSENRDEAVFSGVLAALLAAVLYVNYTRYRKLGRLELLERGVDDTKEAMKKLQKEYFEKEGLSKKSYDARMKKYKKRLAEAMEDLESARAGGKEGGGNK